ncbi:MAG: DUF3990 domain-containing protein [Bradyrhizobium sp.]
MIRSAAIKAENAAVAWSNAPARVYHGTTLAHAQLIVSHGINPRAGRGAADFGQGFYVTTTLHQAQQWANQKVRNLPSHVAGIAAVLSFDLDRDLAAACEHLTFVLADSDYHDFVLFNRLGSATHGRSGGAAYALVHGPVAAFPQSITYANCDQICCIGANAVAALGAPLGGIATGNPLFP